MPNERISDLTKSLQAKAHRLHPWAVDRTDPGTWFCWRLEIEVEEGCSSLPVRLAVDSKYWLWINGELLIREGGLKRGPKPKGSYVDCLEIGRRVTPGRNILAIHHWYFGLDSFSHKDSGYPELYIEFGCASVRLASCKVLPDPASFDAGTVRPGAAEGPRLAEGSVGHDARKANKNWQALDFDASEWLCPIVKDAQDQGKLGPLTERPIPQFTWLDPVDIVPNGWQEEVGGYRLYTIELPANIQYVPRLRLQSLKGLKIQILSDAPTHVLTAEYITSDGEQSWESPGWMNGHRIFFRIPEDVEVLSLGYRETRYAAQKTGFFHCSDPVLNDLWNRSARTLQVTMRDTFLDCPCRERAHWWGDEVIQLGQISYCLESSAQQLVRKGIYELAAWQSVDGKLFSPIPSGNWDREIPLQMLASISTYGFQEYYWHTNDFQPLEDTFEAVKAYLKLWPEDGQRIPIVREGDWNWGDWGTNLDMELLTAGWLILAWIATSRTARQIGQVPLAKELEEKAIAMRKTVRERCRVEGGFRGPAHEGPLDDRSNALMVLAGITISTDHSEMGKTLYTQRHASPYMEKYVLEALCSIGLPESALARMRERYACMLNTSSSTLWEFFPDAGFQNNTYNHSWSGGPLIILSRIVAGLYPAEPGWTRIGLRPQPAALDSFNVKLETPKGAVSMHYQRKNNVFELTLNAPATLKISYDLILCAGPENLILHQAGSPPRKINPAGTLPGGTFTIKGRCLASK